MPTDISNGTPAATGVRFFGTGSGNSASSVEPAAPRSKSGKTTDLQIPRLARAMDRARMVLQYFRTERRAAVKQYVGKHWGEGGSEKKMPLNLLSLYVQVVGRNLVAKNPRVMVTSRNPKIAPQVSAMQDWCNQRVEEMHLDEELRRYVEDALYCIGIMKVGIATPADAVVGGYTAPAGVPFAESIDLDDFVFDISARKFKEASFMGHRFRIPVSEAENLGYDTKAVKKMPLTGGNRSTNQGGDERIESLGRDYQITDDDEYDPMVELWEIYLPRLRKVVVLAADDSGVPPSDLEPLSVRDWFGPACGPYHILGFLWVPGNAMPKGTITDLVDLADIVNRLYRKLGNQAERQKEVLPVRGGAVDDAKKLVQANDGEAFGCDNADTIKAVSYGGPNAVNLNFAVHTKDLFSFMGGNLDLLGGRSPQSKTASQDKLLNDNASAGVSDMQEATVKATASVLSALLWFWWHHPAEVMRTKRTAGPGLEDIAITRELYPRGALDSYGNARKFTREGRYEELMLRVDPYSMRYRSPQERLQFLSGLVQQMLPMLPILQQQGVMFDAQFYMKKVAEYSDEPDVAQLFTIQEPPPPTDGGGAAEPLGGAGGPNGGDYVRRSVGSDTQANREAEMTNAASEQASEQAG